MSRSRRGAKRGSVRGRTVGRVVVTVEPDNTGGYLVVVRRAYHYNRRENSSVLQLRDMRLVWLPGDGYAWGAAWSQVFDAVLEMQQSQPQRMELELEAPQQEGPAWGIRMMVWSVAYELGLSDAVYETAA